MKFNTVNIALYHDMQTPFTVEVVTFFFLLPLVYLGL